MGFVVLTSTFEFIVRIFTVFVLGWLFRGLWLYIRDMSSQRRNPFLESDNENEPDALSQSDTYNFTAFIFQRCRNKADAQLYS
ncbi:hypothetical protein AGMMS49975_11090 [Clostridia bacterium]|nr:hypothetical protein AGMMS49975_11090 [Clostridia bacterium]